MPAPSRVDAVTVPPTGSPAVRPGHLASSVDRLTRLAVYGLKTMYQSGTGTFPQTVRRANFGVVPEGLSVRYTAIAALGLARLPPARQAEALAGGRADVLVPAALERSLQGDDPGAVALAAWAAAEILVTRPSATDVGMPAPQDDDRLADLVERAYDRLITDTRRSVSIPTVDHSWTLTALVAAWRRVLIDDAQGLTGPFLELADRLGDAARTAAARLLAAQGPGGLFPHHLPAQELGRFRAHVGCFADQVYPIQALARYAAATGDPEALAAADGCARRICELQGPAGQWWWHYDARDGSVVEGYPVYSVHQHAMAPMALFELREAGGQDFTSELLLGLSWLFQRPESNAELIDDERGVVWRKIGRREQAKAVRTIRAVSTSLRSGLRLGALDAVFPPGPVDHECRPYELGWLLYAWHGAGEVDVLRPC